MQAPHHRWRAFALAALLGATVLGIAAQPRATAAQSDYPSYQLIDLGRLDLEGFEPTSDDCSGNEGVPYAISAGNVVVGFFPLNEERIAPGVFTETERTRVRGGSGGGQVRGINSSGQMVGFVYETRRSDPCKFPTDKVPALWIDGELTRLPIPDWAIEGQAMGISDDGLVAGWVRSSNGVVTPVTWPDPVTITPLDMPDVKGARATSGVVTGVSPNGTITGYARWEDEDGKTVRQSAVIWGADGVTRLEGLAERTGNVGTAVNDSGVVVGYAPNDAGMTVATIWMDGEATQLAPTQLTTESGALGINTIGSVVGYAETVNGPVGLMWLNGEVINLNMLAPGSGFAVIRATDINDLGAVSAIATDPDGIRHAVLLIPNAAG